MKKLFFYLLTILALNACKSDESKDNPKDDPKKNTLSPPQWIQGTWDQLYVTEYDNSGKPVEFQKVEEVVGIKQAIKFTANDIIQINNSSETSFVGYYSLFGATFAEEKKNNEYIIRVTYLGGTLIYRYTYDNKFLNGPSIGLPGLDYFYTKQ